MEGYLEEIVKKKIFSEENITERDMYVAGIISLKIFIVGEFFSWEKSLLGTQLYLGDIFT